MLPIRVGAAPPRCKKVEQDGRTFDVCERSNTECKSLTEQQQKQPSGEWNGCNWPAIVTQSTYTAAGIVLYHIHVTVVASYQDSERMDVTVKVEEADHTYKTYVRKDVPLIMRNDISSASIGITRTFDSVGVPTVEATEKGGKKEAEHRYR